MWLLLHQERYRIKGAAKSSSKIKRRQYAEGKSLHGSLESVFHEAVRMKPRICWIFLDIGDFSAPDISSDNSRLGMEPSQQRYVLQSTKLERVVDSKTHLIQNLEFAVLRFGLASIQEFLTMPPFIPFWNDNIRSVSYVCMLATIWHLIS